MTTDARRLLVGLAVAVSLVVSACSAGTPTAGDAGSSDTVDATPTTERLGTMSVASSYAGLGSSLGRLLFRRPRSVSSRVEPASGRAGWARCALAGENRQRAFTATRPCKSAAELDIGHG